MIPMSSSRLVRLAAVLVTVGAAGCAKSSSDETKVPLGQVAQTENPHDALPPAARTAIDSGNVLFRAGNLDAALSQYRAAAAAAPANAAPWFGVYMVAQKQNRRALADSAMKQINALAVGQGRMLTDTAMEKLHTAR